MAAPNTKPGCRSLQTLPTELLLEISKYITDFPSLNGLLTLLVAHNRGVSFVEDFQTEIFANVIRAGREHELSRVVTAVMTLRNDSMTKRILLMKGAKENFLYKYLRSADRERDGKPHYLQSFSDPIATIHDIRRVSEGIEALVQDFAQTRIVKPSEQPERPPSSTELHRIRRAFWRFQLCYELVHAEDSIPSGAEDEAQSERSRRFVHYRTHQVGKPCFPKSGWLYGHTGNKISPTVHYYMRSTPAWAIEEIEATRFHPASLINTFQHQGQEKSWAVGEIEAVRFHLASLINAFQYQGQRKASCLSWQPELLQRLIKDLDHWGEDKENPVDHLLVAELRPEHDQSPIADREQWGWGMWDAERLSKRGLKSDSQHKHSRRLSDKAFRECEDAQSTYIDRWVAQKFRDDVRPVEEEIRQRQEQELRVLNERMATLQKPLSAKKARREAKVVARDTLKNLMKEWPYQRKS